MTRISGAWIERLETRAVLDLLETAGYRALFVGGCVRDALAGRAVKDIDMATDARPDTVVALAEAAGLQAIPTGIDHGTITVVSGGTPFEITTFRRDIETDGRRAVVAYSDRIEEDAMRRDLTINALYADRRGVVLDPMGTGIRDLDRGLVRFVGEADARIREDYLRSLRYFRFLACYGDPNAGSDPDALAAISANLGGLDTLAAERIGHEMRRLLDAPDPGPAVAVMAQTGALGRVLPGADITALGPLVHLEGENGIAPNWLRRLLALGGEDPVDRLRLSRQEQRDLDRLRRALERLDGNAELGYRLGRASAMDVALIRAAATGTPLAPDTSHEIALGADAEFPVKAADLMPGLTGPDLGARLDELERHWIASGFALGRDDLLSK